MKDTRLIRIPEKEELRREIYTNVYPVISPETPLGAKIFEGLLRLAGQEKYPMGIITGITFTLNTCYEGFTKESIDRINGVIPRLIWSFVTDETLRNETVDIYKGMASYNEENVQLVDKLIDEYEFSLLTVK